VADPNLVIRSVPVLTGGDLLRGSLLGIEERANLSVWSVLSRQRDLTPVINACRSRGVDLVNRPAFTSSPMGLDIVGVGPGQWLFLQDRAKSSDVLNISDIVGSSASVFDVSGGRTVFRISGAYARKTLQKGVLIDLHPSSFKSGSALATVVGHVSAQIWRVDDRPTYDIAVFRSFARAIYSWLLEASAEFNENAPSQPALSGT
jgi:heterotetrameric sarcosine oxidase gamma subunit